MSCEHPPVSVIICTTASRPTLSACVESVLAQQCARAEFVVVINGADDANLRHTLSSRYPVRVLCEPRRGICYARNHGVARTTGELLAFLDDDIVAHEGWLHALLNGFTDPAVACVTGRVIPQGEGYVSPRRAQHFYFGTRAMSEWTLDGSQTGWHRFPLGSQAGLGCNMAFRRSFLDRFSLFPVDLGAGAIIGAGDEVYMFYQVLKHGLRLRHTPDAKVTHPFAEDLGTRRRRMRQILAASVAFRIKLIVEEKGHRWLALRYLLTGTVRFIKVASRETSAPDPDEPVSGWEKVLACLSGPALYWKSRRSRRA